MKKNIINNVSTSLALILISLLVFIIVDNPEPKVYNGLELQLTYKNCIIISKKDDGNTYKLMLYNPTLHSKDNRIQVDHTVNVEDYIYFNKFIGDKIK